MSVGELLAIQSLVKRLTADPGIELVITTTTSTGLRVLEEQLAPFTVWHGVFPLDFWLCSRSAWRALQPDMAILMEGELWPEHLHQARKRGVPALLVNARLSDRSYARHVSLRRLARGYLGGLEAILAGSVTDQQRFRSLAWIPPEKIHLTGNLKLDAATQALPEPAASAGLRAETGFAAGSHTVLLGSSTWPGEETALLDAFVRLRPDSPGLRLLLVPRHAERRGELEELAARFPVQSHFRSRGRQAPSGTEVYFADTTGELRQLTTLADLVFVGKSLPPNSGGQTPVEAAAMGKPLLFGPEMSNFRDIARDLLREGAAITVEDAGQLPELVERLLADPAERAAMGARAAACIRASSGATDRVIAFIGRTLA